METESSTIIRLVLKSIFYLVFFLSFVLVNKNGNQQRNETQIFHLLDSIFIRFNILKISKMSNETAFSSENNEPTT